MRIYNVPVPRRHRPLRSVRFSKKSGPLPLSFSISSKACRRGLVFIPYNLEDFGEGCPY